MYSSMQGQVWNFSSFRNCTCLKIPRSWADQKLENHFSLKGPTKYIKNSLAPGPNNEMFAHSRAKLFIYSLRGPVIHWFRNSPLWKPLTPPSTNCIAQWNTFCATVEKVFFCQIANSSWNLLYIERIKEFTNPTLGVITF